MRRDAQTLEPIEQVVHQQDDLKEGFVGCKIFGRDLSQGVRILEFSDDEFRCGVLIVEAPEIQRLQRKIGNKDLIRVSSHLKQMQLHRRFFWNRSTNQNEPFGVSPAMGTVSKLSSSDVPSNASVAKPTKVLLKGSSQSIDNDKRGLFSFDKFDNFVIEERSIGAHVRLTDSTGKLAEDVFQQCPDHSARMSVA